MAVTIRAATAHDEAFLWMMLYYAAHMEQDDAAFDAARADPYLARYVRGWGRPSDLGVIAEADGQPAGAVWSRLLVGEERTYGYIDDETPEIAAAVLPERIGQGIGTALLAAYLERAADQFPAVCLNVRADNPALRLYQRAGFRTVGEIVNRVGSVSYTMVLRF